MAHMICLTFFQQFHCYYCIFARGAGPGCNTREISDKLVNVQDELDELNRQEAELDQLKLRIQQSIKNVNDEVSNSRYPFLKLSQQKVEHTERRVVDDSLNTLVF